MERARGRCYLCLKDPSKPVLLVYLWCDITIGHKFRCARLDCEVEENLDECSTSNGAPLPSVQLWRIKLMLLLGHCSYHTKSCAARLFRGLCPPLLVFRTIQEKAMLSIIPATYVGISMGSREISAGTRSDFEQHIKPSRSCAPGTHTCGG